MLPTIKKTSNSNPLNVKGYIDSPQAIKAKKAVINVKSKDNQCFNMHFDLHYIRME